MFLEEMVGPGEPPPPAAVTLLASIGTGGGAVPDLRVNVRQGLWQPAAEDMAAQARARADLLRFRV